MKHFQNHSAPDSVGVADRRAQMHRSTHRALPMLMALTLAAGSAVAQVSDTEKTTLK